MHAATRRPAVSWPAALLPGALALALMTAGVTTSAAGSSSPAAGPDRAITELHVVGAGH